MNILHTLTLGLVEGLTEFLPVSSTGHLIIVSRALNVDAGEAFEVIIQAGAILAVVWHYRKKFFESLIGFMKREASWLRFWSLILTAFFPAAVIGVAAGRFIHAYLFGIVPVIFALIVGGIAMIIIERKLPDEAEGHSTRGKDFPTTYGEALKIGFAQCLALWPGTSRSMCTILGARLLGFSPKGSAEFSFWLAIPTLIGASVYEGFKYRHEILADTAAMQGLAIGFVVSFAVALVVIRAFLGFLQKHSLEVFGWYRIILGLALIALWVV